LSQLQAALNKIRNRFKDSAHKVTEPKDVSERERNKGFKILANTPDGKHPSNKTIRERVKVWLHGDAFAHNRTRDDEVNHTQIHELSCDTDL
jgi:hypothetical protein